MRQAQLQEQRRVALEELRMAGEKGRHGGLVRTGSLRGAALGIELRLRIGHRSMCPSKTVAVGPVSGKFAFKIALAPSADQNHMDLKISGGGFGSVVDLLAGADVKDNGDGTTSLDYSATASMRGPVATVGGRVLDAQAKRIISTTFANIKAKLT